MHDQIAYYSVLMQQQHRAAERTERTVAVAGRELRRSRRSRRPRWRVQ